MEWVDNAIVLAVRPYGEKASVVSLFTQRQGRHAGLVYNYYNNHRVRGTLQPGNTVHACWRGRLAEQLGVLTCELLKANTAILLERIPRLYCLASACAVAELALPERIPCLSSFNTMSSLIQELIEDYSNWAVAYVRWEMILLTELGYGLDLTVRRILEGANRSQGSYYLSLKTGKLIQADKKIVQRSHLEGSLFLLPSFLLLDKDDLASVTATDIVSALYLTGFLLQRCLSIALPTVRKHLVRQIQDHN